jgi:branched-chain amino acid transport system substrate-binding protein
MMKRGFALCALLPLLAVVAACGSASSKVASPHAAASSSSSGAGPSKSPVVIGNIGTYSGLYAHEYTPGLHSLQAWVQWTNDHGGVNGHPVKLVSADDGNDPAKGLVAVRKMVENDHVVAIVSPLAPTTDSAWAAYVQQKGVPVVGGISLTAPWLSNPDFFATGVTLFGYLHASMAAAKSIGTRVGVVLCAEIVACKSGVPLQQKAAADVGIAYVGAQFVAASATDYTAQCLSLKEQHADVLVASIDWSVLARVGAACKTQGVSLKFVVSGSALNKSTIGDPTFNGTVGVNTSPLWFGSSALTKDFTQAYSQQFPDDPTDGYSTLGWQAGVVLAKVLENAPATITSQTVIQGLYAQPAGSTFGGWTPALTYASGKPATVAACVWYPTLTSGSLAAPKGTAATC